MYPLATKTLNCKQAATAELPAQKERALPQPAPPSGISTSSSSAPGPGTQVGGGPVSSALWDRVALGAPASDTHVFSWDLVNHLSFHSTWCDWFQAAFRSVSVVGLACGEGPSSVGFTNYNTCLGGTPCWLPWSLMYHRNNKSKVKQQPSFGESARPLPAMALW